MKRQITIALALVLLLPGVALANRTTDRVAALEQQVTELQAVEQRIAELEARIAANEQYDSEQTEAFGLGQNFIWFHILGIDESIEQLWAVLEAPVTIEALGVGASIEEQVAATIPVLQAGQAIIQAYYNQYGVFPAGNEPAGLPPYDSPELVGEYFTGPVISGRRNGTVQINFNDGADPALYMGTVEMRVVSASPGEMIVWRCFPAQFPSEHWPTGCNQN